MAGGVGRPLLSLSNVSKHFDGEKALDALSLDIDSGEIHALVGQNGSGKSTLIKILTGYHDADPGARITLNGRPAKLGSSHVYAADDVLPVRVVHQDSALVLGLNAVDNIGLSAGFRGRRGRVDWAAQRAYTRAALRLVHADDLDLTVPVGQLEMVERAQIAIARALVNQEHPGGLLLLDEPTSALSETEANQLFQILDRMRAAGASILYVSHRLDEVLRIADRISVIRDGRRVATHRPQELTYGGLVRLMVGNAVELESETTLDASAPSAPSGRCATAPSPRRDMVISDVRSAKVQGFSVTVSPGEIVGVTGLAGAGHEDLPALLVGISRAQGGRIRVDQTEVDLRAMNPRTAMRIGITLVPGDRAGSGLVTALSTARNISLPRSADFSRGGRFSKGLERADARRWIESLQVHPARPELPVTALSGGNQQKVVLAKCLAVATAGLVLSDPTAGVDVAARASIYHRIRNEAAAGLPVLVCSADPEDLVHLCDRVIVLSRGRIGTELARDQITKEAILHACGRDHVTHGNSAGAKTARTS